MTTIEEIGRFLPILLTKRLVLPFAGLPKHSYIYPSIHTYKPNRAKIKEYALHISHTLVGVPPPAVSKIVM